jgi:hypothetical protein
MNTNWRDDPRRLRLMEWLTTPKSERRPATTEGLARELGCSVGILYAWQKKPDFRAAWELRAQDVVGTPDRARAVLDTLFVAATDPKNRAQVQAAKLYLEATNQIRPPQLEVTVKKPSDLTDDELNALLAQGAAALQEERNAAADPRPEAVADEGHP